MKKFWILLSFSNFFIAALFGLLLRAAFVWEINWIVYRNILHAHSHLAMLGWVYMGIFALFCHHFIPTSTSRRYSRLFWVTQISVIGMMISFPLQGYAAVSISFATLHILASYVFCYRVWKDQQIAFPAVRKLVYCALVFLVLSTFGVWLLGPLAVTGGRNTALYQVAIQHYLHFQFHGWFTFAILAIFLNSLLGQRWEINNRVFSWFFYLFTSATVLSFGLVLFWAYGTPAFQWVNNLGILLQLASIGIFLTISRDGIRMYFNRSSYILNLIFRFGLLFLLSKIVIHSVSIFPEMADAATTLRPLMMGFVHLTVLGFVSSFLLGFISQTGHISADSNQFLMALILFLSGIVFTEVLLFSQGLSYWMQWGQLPYYHEMLFVFSAMLPLSILVIVFQVKNINAEITKMNTVKNTYN
ncbi:hypothetical protein [Cyclobacterium lianum]|nr:hypothetical protein [Cyclobacterium lianum]